MLYSNPDFVFPTDFTPTPPVARAPYSLDEATIYRNNKKRLRSPIRVLRRNHPSIITSAAEPNTRFVLPKSCWKNHVLTDSAPGSLTKVTIAELPNKGRIKCMSSFCRSRPQSAVQDPNTKPENPQNIHLPPAETNSEVSYGVKQVCGGGGSEKARCRAWPSKIKTTRQGSCYDMYEVLRLRAAKDCMGAEVCTFNLWGELRRAKTEVHLSLPTKTDMELEKTMNELSFQNRRNPSRTNYIWQKRDLRNRFPGMFYH